MKQLTDAQKLDILTYKALGFSSRDIAEKVLGRKSRKSTVNDFLAAHALRQAAKNKNQPKIAIIDIETAPLRGAVWGMWMNNLGLNQIETDWYILSFSAKWLGSNEVMYEDLRGYVSEEDDTLLLDSLWDVLNEADIVIAHNGRKFDIKKINARFIQNGYERPDPYKIIDTLEIAKRGFAFTSNKLEYLTKTLNKTYKKSDHGSFQGYTLWSECLNDNLAAWNEMEKYNRLDVLSLEELYLKFRAWDDKHPNLALYYDDDKIRCGTCGSADMVKVEDKYVYTNLSKFELFTCKCCGTKKRARVNVRTKSQMKNTLMNI